MRHESLVSPNSTFSAKSDAGQNSPHEANCSYPKAPARPITKGRKKIRACILAENEEAISYSREKELKNRCKSQKQLETSKKKKTKRIPCAKRKEAQYQESSDEMESEEMHLDVSSKYSNEVGEEDTEEPRPFQGKTPETNDLILTELELEERIKVYYVVKILSVEEKG